ncbi:SurA N-terminal domain-containing protein [Undibacterium oligocarboniphilum]|uniref:Periplasmic chaperone PpiD n=1 Tax=Undibacterium oligocarboniphilum TaxID=666702 RepID=A0A850QK52_9BURK|nr:SurA N-terminal domain-containing protein [Undibacterium oligocarboniphilum]MBC3868813.1 SurA N-terminal domain-containing protein [Undibacterium oligocarboniphilum]NVO76794.1 SurA N-terminal domain-containing protein [Undibacterium oligocarboniphilum]
MFEYIRTHQRLMQFLLLLIIFPSFAFFGIESYTRSQAASGSTVATVAGQSISQQELDAALRDQLERFRQSYGPQFDPKMMNTPEVRQGVLDELVARKAVSAEIRASKIAISDQMLQKQILSIPGLLKADGGFDKEKYLNYLASQGMNQAIFDQRLRQDLSVEQLTGAIQNTGFIPETVAERVAMIGEQEREIQALTFKPADFTAQVKVTDEMIKSYYEKNAAQFEIPETVKAEYVVLNQDALLAQLSASDSEIAEFYKNNSKSYSVDEQRRASHILIAVKKDASDADKAKAKAKAESLLTEVRKNPSSFAKLAKENSQDPGSAERGGDLDFFGKGAMVKPFEDVAYKLQKGEISDVVQSDFGYHIIQVTDIRAASVKPLEEVKGQIAADIKKQKAAKAYAEAAETFGNTVYEQSDSLKAVADKLKLKIEVVDGLTRQGSSGLPPAAPVNNTKLLKALFSDDAIKKKHNTEAIEVAPNTLISARILDYKAASKRPLDDVRAAIVARVTQAEAQAIAEKEGAAKLAALKAADSVSGFAEPKLVSRSKTQDIPAQAVAQIMKADTQKLPAFVGVSSGAAGYAIYRIAKVNAGTPDKARRQSEKEQITNLQSQEDLLAYLELLKRKAKTSVNKAALTAVSQAQQ